MSSVAEGFDFRNLGSGSVFTCHIGNARFLAVKVGQVKSSIDLTGAFVCWRFGSA
jgi:hypothetical protein